MTEAELKDILDYFADKVDKTKLTEKERRINYFSATKMLSLETKHSAFFAWLLDPKNEHCLGDAVLKKLLYKIWYHDTKPDKDTKDVRSNQDILKDTNKGTELAVSNCSMLLGLADSKSVHVFTEKTTDNGKRIDILIDIVDTQTVIAIENKIDSFTHDNQLREYQEYVAAKYANYKKKIFLFLAKPYQLPYDTDEKGKRTIYNENWCVIDYGDVCCIIEDLIHEITDKLSTNATKNASAIDIKELQTLKTILEHYKEMVKTSILNTSSVARSACRKLLSDPKVKEALEIIAAYQRIPTDEQIEDYVRKYLGCVESGTSSRYFYLPEMKEYFIKHGEEYNIGMMRCVCQPVESKEDSKIIIWVEVTDDNNRPKGLTKAQTDLLHACNITDPKHFNRPMGKNSFELVLEKERGLELDELKAVLNPRLDLFKKQLDEFVKNYL